MHAFARPFLARAVLMDVQFFADIGVGEFVVVAFSLAPEAREAFVEAAIVADDRFHPAALSSWPSSSQL